MRHRSQRQRGRVRRCADRRSRWGVRGLGLRLTSYVHDAPFALTSHEVARLMGAYVVLFAANPKSCIVGAGNPVNVSSVAPLVKLPPRSNWRLRQTSFPTRYALHVREVTLVPAIAVTARATELRSLMQHDNSQHGSYRVRWSIHYTCSDIVAVNHVICNY